jgi:hypothetical protein
VPESTASAGAGAFGPLAAPLLDQLTQPCQPAAALRLQPPLPLAPPATATAPAEGEVTLELLEYHATFAMR